MVTATAGTSITGSTADIYTALVTNSGTSDDKINTSGSIIVSPSSGSFSVTEANNVAAKTSGVITATISDGETSKLTTLTGTTNDYTILVTDSSVDAAALNTIDSKTIHATVGVTSGTITGNKADIRTALVTNATHFTFTGSQAVTVGDSASVAELNAIRLKTTGLITATASDNSAATLAGLTGTNNAYTITVTGSSIASDLKLIDAVTTLTVGASGVGTITGNETDIKDVVQAVGITKATNYAVTVDSGTLSVANANIIDAANGNLAITATITAGTRVSDLKTLTATDTTNAYNITIDAADANSPAADLKTIDGITSVNVAAANVTTLTGAASDIKDVLLSSTIDTRTDVIATVTGTTALATDLTTINTNNGTGAIGTSTLTTITGTAAQIHAAYGISMTGIGAANLTVDSGTPTVLELNNLAGDTSGVVTGSISGTASALAALTNTSGSTPAYTVTVDSGSVAAADLNTINGVTTVNVVATAVTEITGTTTDIVTALSASNGITNNPSVNITATTGGISVADDIAKLNTIAGRTSGTITATLTGIVDELKNLSPSSNNITLIVSSTGTENATDLNTINNATSNTVDATAVTNLTGTALAIKTLLAADVANSITLGMLTAVTVSDTATATDLNYIDADPNAGAVTVTVNATAVTAISGSAADVYTTLVTNTSTTTVNNPIITITDAASTASN